MNQHQGRNAYAGMDILQKAQIARQREMERLADSVQEPSEPKVSHLLSDLLS